MRIKRAVIWSFCLFFIMNGNFGTGGSVQAEEADQYEITKAPADHPVLFRGTHAAHDVYFEIGKGQRSDAGSYFDLVYSHSPVLEPELSWLSVWIDDMPLTVLQLDRSDQEKQHQRMDLSHLGLEPGIHKLSLRAQMKLTRNQCEDPRHDALWMIIHEETSLYLELSPVYETADLSWYPSPFLERGNDQAVKAAIVVPDSIEQAEFRAAAQLSQFLYSQMSSPTRPIAIYTESDLTPSLLESGHLIWIGRDDRWKGAGKQAADAANQGVTADEAGHITLMPSLWNEDYSLLYVSGDDEQLEAAAGMLTKEDLFAQFKGRRIPLSAPLPASEPTLPEPGFPYRVTLEDLGYDHLKVENTLLGSTSFHYPIPGNVDLTQGTRLQLEYTHSGAILPDRSVMTVRVNGSPVYSTALHERTSGGGSLDIPVDPRLVMPNRTLSVDVVFQFAGLGKDGNREWDCDDVILGNWGMIGKDSALVIAPVERQGEYLQSLPFPFVTGERWESTLFLFERLGSRELQLAMTWIGLMGRDSADVSRLEIAPAAAIDQEKPVKDRHVIYVGTPAGLPSALNGYPESYVAFENNQIVSQSPKVPLIPSLQRNFAAVQLTRSPYDAERRALMFVAASSERFNDLAHAFLDPEERTKIAGRFIAVDEKGIVLNYAGTEDARLRSYRLEERAVNERWSDFSISGIVFVILFLIVLFAVGWAAYRAHRNPERS